MERGRKCRVLNQRKELENETMILQHILADNLMKPAHKNAKKQQTKEKENRVVKRRRRRSKKSLLCPN